MPSCRQPHKSRMVASDLSAMSPRPRITLVVMLLQAEGYSMPVERAGGTALRDARLAEQEALPEIDVQIQHFEQHRLGLDALDDQIDGIGIERALQHLGIGAEQALARRIHD